MKVTQSTDKPPSTTLDHMRENKYNLLYNKTDERNSSLGFIEAVHQWS